MYKNMWIRNDSIVKVYTDFWPVKTFNEDTGLI